MVYIEKSEKSVQEVVDKIQEIIPNYKFGVQHIHNIKETLISKGIDFKNECQVLDVCNPKVANEFLTTDMSLSSIMPCKISIYEEDGETLIAMNSLAQLVDDINPDLTDIAQTTQKTILEIIKEAI
ncbi:protein of unknown function DUF302 [Arcobacter nitrofigilis DSM 7299]|uniref:DUF302 domain-containing protein n=1 Tax=Arcobacter nitrofigilis (strain ATCC 33309 / DSM 7299 / CCUG 15893 / LMG 7604 / NCTC 12251 / CI) TaxID=572480 RepID=D5UZP9_ARCNC|nr:DUF302 domain-containing protein [Arcobacter nitrofigilis]ADG93268.1 protein of unknown function DUF302 [Arcobacter nitrofigilis DSM 7299]